MSKRKYEVEGIAGTTTFGGDLALTELCYSDIAEIRKVFSERRHRLWLDQWKGRSKQDPEKLMELQKKAYSRMFEMSPIGRCNRILEACQDVEDQIQAALAENQKKLDES